MPYIATERVKTIRETIRAKYPECKFSITKRHSSTVVIDIMESPYKWDEGDYIQLNHYYLENYAHSDFLKDLYAIANEGNGTLVEDGDYGTVPRFYVDMNIGQWEKPHVTRQFVTPPNVTMRKCHNCDELKPVGELSEYGTILACAPCIKTLETSRTRKGQGCFWDEQPNLFTGVTV